jgi:hypothetical protein
MARAMLETRIKALELVTGVKSPKSLITASEKKKTFRSAHERE